MKKSMKICAMGLFFMGALQVSAAFTLLHEFADGAEDGASPYMSQLLKDGSTLYGMTNAGGDSGAGTVFKINADGTGFSLLHEFIGSPGDGSYPYGSLILDGSTLYGMTPYGGGSGVGVIFKIGTDGSGYDLLHEFAGGADDGSYPMAR